MGVDKSLEEVREWKDKIYEEDKNLTEEQILYKIRAETSEIIAALGLKAYTKPSAIRAN